VTLSRLTFAYFTLALFHCSVQIAFQIDAFLLEQAPSNLFEGIIATGNVTEKFAMLDTNENLELCHAVPGQSGIVPSCMTYMGRSKPPDFTQAGHPHPPSNGTKPGGNSTDGDDAHPIPDTNGTSVATSVPLPTDVSTTPVPLSTASPVVTSVTAISSAAPAPASPVPAAPVSSNAPAVNAVNSGGSPFGGFKGGHPRPIVTTEEPDDNTPNIAFGQSTPDIPPNIPSASSDQFPQDTAPGASSAASPPPSQSGSTPSKPSFGGGKGSGGNHKLSHKPGFTSSSKGGGGFKPGSKGGSKPGSKPRFSPGSKGGGSPPAAHTRRDVRHPKFIKYRDTEYLIGRAQFLAEALPSWYGVCQRYGSSRAKSCGVVGSAMCAGVNMA